MGVPVFKFTLSHTPKTSVSTGITIPPNSEGENVAGSGNDWSSGNAPSVTVSGSSGSRQSDIWANDYGFGTGLSYTINYSVGYSINANVIATTVFFVVLDVANNILIFDSKSIVGTGTGTLNDSSTFTAPGGAVKFGFYVVIVNALSNSGSSFDINGITGSVATVGESGSPSSVTITEPMGWKDSKLKLERHPDFHSLVEYFETGLVYYGSNGVDNGGINFLKAKEQEYGYKAKIVETIEADIDGDGIFEEQVFTGLKDLVGLQEIPDNKMEVATIRNDMWANFISRLDTPVDLRSTTTLDGDPCSPVEPVTINLPSQTIRKQYRGENKETSGAVGSFSTGNYFQMDYDVDIISEIEKKFNLPLLLNTEKPVWNIEVAESGTYTFNFTSYVYFQDLSFGVAYVPANIDTTETVNFYLDINGFTTYKFSWEVIDFGGAQGINKFFLNQTVTLNKGDQVSFYGIAEDNFTGILAFFKWNGTDFYYSRNYKSSLTITADTTYPSSEAEGFFLHDAFAGVIERIVGRNAFYSEILGRTDTNMRQYLANGCFSKNVLLKGLQIRGYSLSQKPFFASFNHLWKGADPIFNLGLGYETIGNTEYIRLEEKSYFYDNDVSIDISNVRQITREYDPDVIYNKIEVGYTKWQSESAAGIDDPQTKRTYAIE